MSPGPMFRWIAPLLMLLAATPAVGQQGAATLTVTVLSGATSRPLQGARVSVQGLGLQGTTDAAGRVRLRGLAAGSRTVSVQFLGFSPVQTSVMLPLEGALDLAVELEPRPVQLAELRVRAKRPSILYSNGFYTRKRDGSGTFLTRQEIQRTRPRHLSDVLRRLPGVELTPLAGGTARASMRGNSNRNCPIQYYLDGVLTGFFNADDVAPDDVEGVEIYRGAASIPPQFNRGTALCGVVVIWTRVE